MPQNFTANERAEKDLQSLTETGESEDEYDDDLSLDSENNSMILSKDASKIKLEDYNDSKPPSVKQQKVAGEGKDQANMDESFKAIAVTGKPNCTEGNESDPKADADADDDDMFDHAGQMKFDWQQIFLQEKMMGEPQSIP